MAFSAVPLFILIALLSSEVFGVPSDRRDLSRVNFVKGESAVELYQDYLVKFGKLYALDDILARLPYYIQGLLEIDNLNNAEDEGGARYEVNQFADWSSAEIDKMLNLKPEDPADIRSLPVVDLPAGEVQIPSEVDWRSKNKVTEVKNQGFCGSSYTFATNVAIETNYAIKYNSLRNFSEQQLLDCDNMSSGCDGGWMPNSLTSIQERGGIMSAEAYPYTGSKGACEFKASMKVAEVSQVARFRSKDEAAIARFVASMGAVPVAINACKPFLYYKSGIFDKSDAECSQAANAVNHAVAIVGYGTDVETNKDYWIIKNSWGPSWGEDGYMRIRRNGNVCGLSNYAWQVSVK